MIELLRANPQNSARIVLERLKAKLQEIKLVKNSHKPIWKDIAEKNFHRSLDHRSFHVKVYEKKLTNAKRKISRNSWLYLWSPSLSLDFVKDARLRYKNLQKPIPDTVTYHNLSPKINCDNTKGCEQVLADAEYIRRYLQWRSVQARSSKHRSL